MRHTLSLFCLCSVLSVLGGIFHAHAANYQYVAITEASAAAKQGPVRAGLLTWQCSGNQCTISGPWPSPGMSSCQMLAREVGKLRSYGHSGAQLTPTEMARCNSVLPGAAKGPVPSIVNEGKVLESSININSYVRLSPARPMWGDMISAMNKLKQSIDQYNQANQVVSDKIRTCIPADKVLAVDQQRGAGCNKTDSVQACYQKFIEQCTYRERAALETAKRLMGQDGAGLKAVLNRYTFMQGTP